MCEKGVSEWQQNNDFMTSLYSVIPQKQMESIEIA